jgi:hypothetical protein
MPPERRIILHVGVHKTGTSAIQIALTRNRARLLDQGVLYPLAGCPADPALHFGQHEVPWAILGRDPDSPVLDRLRAEMVRSAAKRVILSSEEFDRLDDAQVRAAAEALPGRKTVIFYYRRQSDVLQGTFATEVCFNRDQRSIDAFATDLDVGLNYLRLARRWAAAVGKENVIARPYVREDFEGGNILCDFARLAGITFDAESIADTSNPNKSIPSFATLAIQQMWKQGIPAETVLRTVAAVQGATHHDACEHAFLTSAERLAYDRRFAEDNAAFLAEFGDEGTTALSPRPGNDDARPEGRWSETASLCATIALLSAR